MKLIPYAAVALLCAAPASAQLTTNGAPQGVTQYADPLRWHFSTSIDAMTTQNSLTSGDVA